VLGAVSVDGVAAVQGAFRYKSNLAAVQRPNGIETVCAHDVEAGSGDGSKLSQRGWAGAIGIHDPEILSAVGDDGIAAVKGACRCKAILLPSGDQTGALLSARKTLRLVNGVGPEPSAFITQMFWVKLVVGLMMPSGGRF